MGLGLCEFAEDLFAEEGDGWAVGEVSEVFGYPGVGFFNGCVRAFFRFVEGDAGDAVVA